MTVHFIGIGAQKSATSWLHDMLSDHPGICASDPKELNYFTANYDRGAIWYEAMFAGARPGQVCGECSPTYFFSADAPMRAHDYNPAMRLVAILRDPVARMFSNHLHELRKKHIPASVDFETALAANPAYRAQSAYAANLGRWLQCFDRDQLLVLLAEDIARDPAAAYAEVCAHLSVAAGHAPEALGRRSHESVANRSDGVQAALRALGDTARKAGLGRRVNQIKDLPPVAALLRVNRHDLRQAVPPIPEARRMELAAEFVPDMVFVADLMGRDSLPWPSFDAVPQRPRNRSAAGASS